MDKGKVEILEVIRQNILHRGCRVSFTVSQHGTTIRDATQFPMRPLLSLSFSNWK